MHVVSTYFKVKPLQGAVALGAALRSASDPAAAARQQEYLDCLCMNCRHPEVERVHLLVEGEAAYAHLTEHILDPSLLQRATGSSGRTPLTTAQRRKIIPVLRLHPFMPVYADLFHHANQFSQGCLTMVCNADVYLSHTHFSVSSVQSLFDAASECPARTPTVPAGLALALTRYESEDGRDAPLIADYRGSHDAFIVVPPLPGEFLMGVGHPQNCYQAENVVIYELQKSGYQVVNPCLDLRLVHRHAADVRQWFPSVAENSRYAKAPPLTMAEATAAVREVFARGHPAPTA